VPDNQVIRFDSPNPPLLVHAARAIRACLALERAAARYADEPLPLGYFAPKEGHRVDESPDKITALLDKWEMMRSRRVWGFVGQALEAKVLQFNAEQIQLAEQRQHAVLEIARAAGIDPEDLGVSTTSRTYQNAEQRRLDLLDFTLAHYMTAVEQRLSMGDILPRGYRAKVNLDGFLRSDTKTRMETYKIGSEVSAYLPDEIRELEDRPVIRQKTPIPRDLVPVEEA
jgi:HK97 family phage portal protein